MKTPTEHIRRVEAARERGWFCRIDPTGLVACNARQGVPDVDRVEFFEKHGFDGLREPLPEL